MTYVYGRVKDFGYLGSFVKLKNAGGRGKKLLCDVQVDLLWCIKLNIGISNIQEKVRVYAVEIHMEGLFVCVKYMS